MCLETDSDVLRKTANEWKQWDQDPVTRAEIISILENENSESFRELSDRLLSRIQFGTAGLRAEMKAGFKYMNSLTVIQATQGIAAYLKAHASVDQSAKIIIGHDARHNSRKYALYVARVFEVASISVDIFEDYVPTPFVSFGTRLNSGSVMAAIMITASHNPAKDNGYKVYWSNGCQINTPLDQELAASISQNLEPWPGVWSVSQFSVSKIALLINATAETYLKSLQNLLQADTIRVDDADVPVYTPLHGVGWRYVDEVFTSFGVQLPVVSLQAEPDPDFPTVAFPNPEEHGALDLAQQYADELDKHLIISTDPDADRFAAAQKVNGAWYRFTGDQVGVLLAAYILEHLRDAKDSGREYMLASAVSSTMLKTLCASNNVTFEQTLTGFKWIGNRAYEIEKEGNKVLLGYEEALGYMFTGVSYDKDGIVAACVFLAAVKAWKKQGWTPYEKLQQLYEKYGHFESINIYFRRGADTNMMRTLFESIRSNDTIMKNGQINKGEFRLLRWRDITKGTGFVAPGAEPFSFKLPRDTSSEMLIFEMTNGSASVNGIPDIVTFTLRASGTEPKIKLYLECTSSDASSASRLAYDATVAIYDSMIIPAGVDLEFPKSWRSSGGMNYPVEGDGVIPHWIDSK